MPLLVIEARGEIVKSNFDEFATAIRTRLSDFNLELRTDEEFDQASEDIKRLKSAEDALKKAEETALDQTGDVSRLIDQLRGLKAEISTARLTISRQVDERKSAIKGQMSEAAMVKIQCAPSERAKFRPMIENAIKGLKTMDSMREKIRIAVQVANDAITRSKKVLDEFEQANGITLTPDREQLETTDHVTLATELRRRLEAAQSEAKMKRLREEAAKQVAEAKAKEEAAKKALAQSKQPPAPDLQRPNPADVTDLPWDGPAPVHGETALIESVPAAPTGPTAAGEWEGLRALVIAAFGPIKEYRESMVHELTAQAAKEFGETVNDAWKRANNKVRAALEGASKP